MAIRVLGGIVGFPLSDRVLADDYLVNLGDQSGSDLRVMRGECEQAELAVSFARRILQGHLDIVDSDLRRRHAGGVADANTLHDLVERLPQILADDHARNGSPAHRAIDPAPDLPVEAMLVAIDKAVGGGAAFVDLDRRSDAEVVEVADRLRELERELSQIRRGLHERIDLLKVELSGRYERGEITIDGVLS